MPTSLQVTRRSSEVQSVVRACEILKYIRHADSLVTLDLVCRYTHLPRPSVYRLLNTLVACGMIERVSKNSYRQVDLTAAKPFRFGYASQTEEFTFSRLVSDSIRSAAYRAGAELLVLDNHCSAKAAIRNASIFVRERVDLVIEFQTNHQSASLVASKILEAGIPLIAIEVPHPGATYFGADNYQAGIIAGRALGRRCLQEWNGAVDQIILMEWSAAGPLPRSRMTATIAGLREVLPRFPEEKAIFLDGKGRFEDSLMATRRHLSRNRASKVLLSALNDPSCLGALQAFEEAGRLQQCLAVGQNASIEARQEMRRDGSRLIGSVGYFPERYGDGVMQLAVDLARRRRVPAAAFVKHCLVHPGNVNTLYPNDREIAVPDTDMLLYSKR